MSAPNKFFARDASRAERVERLFSRVAPRYDLINDLQSFGLHRLWKRQVIRLARFGPGQRALDLCCGTGDLAVRLRACAVDDVQVVGLDFSGPMLAEARRRGTDLLHWVRADALRLPFADGVFDVVTIGYGLRNVADLAGALGEVRRVLCPGGRLLVLDFGRPDNALLRSLYFAYLRTVPPLLGQWLCGDADTHGYIHVSLRDYPQPREIERRLRTDGWRNVRLHLLGGGIMAIHYAEA